MGLDSFCGIVAAALLCIFSVAANPISIESRSIDSTIFHDLQLYEQFAAAAYCPSNNNVTAGGTKLTCPVSDNCPLVEANDVTTVYEFQNSLLTDVTGYVAVDHTLSVTVLSFRGSKSVRNWMADLDFPQVPTDICDDCDCAQGFYNSWTEARSGVLAAMSTTAAKYPSYSVAVVGHSLGGAIATIAAAELRNMNIKSNLYTYGAPRIAGSGLSDYITNQGKGANFRTTHYDDPVPMTPPQFFGFVHISPVYHIDTANDIPVTANDIRKLDGDNTGNTANAGNLIDTPAHGWYFNKISACDTSRGLEINKRAGQ